MPEIRSRSFAVAGIFVLAATTATTAWAVPMECTEDTLRMALGGQGTMPGELLRECLLLEPSHPDYPVTQYMISVHYRRRHDFRNAAVFLDRAARTTPFETNPRVLYVLAQYQIAAGEVERGLISKDRFLSFSAALSHLDRMRRTRKLYSLLHEVYEIRAIEAPTPEKYEQYRLTAKFYDQARRHLDREIEKLTGDIAAAPPAAPGRSG